MLGNLFSRDRYQPRWDDRGLVRDLRRSSDHFEGYRRGRSSLEPARLVAGYFRERLSPVFFARLDELRSAAHRIPHERPDWHERTRERLRADVELGFSTYGRPGPPLGPDFPWGELEPGPGGDDLYRRHPHRFSFAPRLALGALYGLPTATVLTETLGGWARFAGSRENGIAYDSNLTVIQRLLALSWAWSFLAAREPQEPQFLEQEFLVLKAVRADVDFLVSRLGRSYANNHLLADVFAGWFIGCVWPELAGGAGLRDRYEPLWLRELSRQILDDGTSFEHSTHYHEYACEMAVAYVLLSRLNRHSFPDWVLERTRRMLAFQAALSGSEGVTLSIGDATEDPLFPLDGGDGWGTSAWREIHRALFGPKLAPAARDAAAVERAFWLLGGSRLAETAGGEEHAPMAAFARGGFYAFHDVARGSRLVFRTGPTEGEALAPGHVHADLMSIYWIEAGIPLTVDPGTYTYRAKGSGWPAGEPDWRAYFRGPEAHNGLSLGGRDPLGEVARNFRRGPLESSVSVSRAESASIASWVHARVQSRGPYGSWSRGVVWIRDAYFVVYDIVPSGGEAQAELGFQFSPDVRLETSAGRRIRIRHGEVEAWMIACKALAEPSQQSGSRAPLGGWFSPRYGEIVEAPRVRFEITAGTGSTALLLSRDPLWKRAEVEAGGERNGGLRIRIACGEIEDDLLVNLGPSGAETASGDLRFRGGLLWIRSVNGVPVKLRWLDGSRCEWPSRGILVSRDEGAGTLEIESDRGEVSVRFCEAESVTLRWPR